MGVHSCAGVGMCVHGWAWVCISVHGCRFVCQCGSVGIVERTSVCRCGHVCARVGMGRHWCAGLGMCVRVDIGVHKCACVAICVQVWAFV